MSLLIACLIIYGLHLPKWLYLIAVVIYLLSFKPVRISIMCLFSERARRINARLAEKEMSDAGEIPDNAFGNWFDRK